jgi:hypothetical protein
MTTVWGRAMVWSETAMVAREGGDLRDGRRRWWDGKGRDGVGGRSEGVGGKDAMVCERWRDGVGGKEAGVAMTAMVFIAHVKGVC